MASLSNFSPTGGQQSHRNRDNLTLSECTCPICMYILIEPVVMPCQHELCMMCFEKNVQEASLCCPLCRKRISTWARRAAKLNKLVDEKRWEAIKTAFPQKVRNRLEGYEEESEEEEEFIHVPNIAAPGEIRVEYERELQKLEAERESVRLEEEAASRELIRQLQEEEEARRREQEQLIEQDEQLVRKLMADDSPASVRTTPKSTMLDRFVRRGHLNSSKSPTSTPSVDPPPWPSASRSTTGGDISSSSLNSLNLPKTPSRLSSGRNSSSVVLIEDTHTSVLSADLNISPGASTSRSASLMQSESSRDSFNLGEEEMDGMRKDEPPQTQRPGSADSMSQELCHFKPIHCSPRTPPRHLVGGRLVDPPVILSTPRNISQMSKGLDEDGPSIPDGSPVMKRRLSQLAEERKEKVAAMSKSTGPDLPLLPSMDGHLICSSDQVGSPPLCVDDEDEQLGSTQCTVRTLSFEAASPGSEVGTKGDGISSTPMILPLEPNLEDCVSSEVEPPAPFQFDTSMIRPVSQETTTSTGPQNRLDGLRQASYQRKKDREKTHSPHRKKQVWEDRRDSSSSTTSLENHQTAPVKGDENMNQFYRGDDAGKVMVTTRLLTPRSLALRKEKVLKGNYTPETPQLLKGRKHQKNNTGDHTERKKKTCTADNQSPLRSHSASSGTITPESDTIEESSVDKKEEDEHLELATHSRGKIDSTKIYHTWKAEAQTKRQQLLQNTDSGSDEKGLSRTAETEDMQLICDKTHSMPAKVRTCDKDTTKEDPEVPHSQVSLAKNNCKKKHATPTKKRSPQKQETPTRRSARTRKCTAKGNINKCDEVSPWTSSENEKALQQVSSEKDPELTESPNKPGLKRVRSTEDKENELSQSDCSSENPAKRTCTNSHEPHEYSEDEVFQTPKKLPQEPHFPVEYSPEVDGKRLKKFPKSRLTAKGKSTKQSKLCFVKTSGAGTSGTQTKLVFTNKTASRRGKQAATSTSSSKSPRKQHKRRSENETSEENSEAEDEWEIPGPKFLDRSHFNSDEEYKQHLEEQDRLLALQLQADFDMERKLRLTAIRRKGTDGQYELRRKGRSKAAVTQSRPKRSK